MTKKRAIVAVINDLVTDRRVQKTCGVLKEQGYEVILIGRKLPQSMAIPDWGYRCVRMNLLFKKGPLFYFFFNLRLFLFLLFHKADLLVANDLDTLGPNYRIHRWKKIPLIYDSHEIFTEVPELMHHPLKKKIWQRLEKKIVPHLKHCITVNSSIARWFEDKYGVHFHVVRNVPEFKTSKISKERTALGLPENKKIVLLQGAGINIQRGAEELAEAMRYTEGMVLLIIGSGDVMPLLKEKAEDPELKNKLMIKGKLPPEELLQYTLNADLGISIDKNTNLNYRFSLPNKIFDYMNAGVPVLASRLPEIESLINKYETGTFIEEHTPTHIAQCLKATLESPMYETWKKNTKRCAEENNWEKEKKVWQNLITGLSA